MKKRFIIAALLVTTFSADKALANDIRQQYQETIKREQQAEASHQFAYTNAQFLQGTDPSSLDAERRIFISDKNVVYEVSPQKLRAIGRTDKTTAGCRFACRFTEQIGTAAFLGAGELGGTDIKEEWQYFVEDGQLVEYSTTRVTAAAVGRGSSTSDPSTSRRVIGLPVSTLPAYRYKKAIQPYHPDNQGEMVKSTYKVSGNAYNCMMNITVMGTRPDGCTQWEKENPEIGFKVGTEVVDQNGWTWCLDTMNGFIIKDEADKNGLCGGPLMVKGMYPQPDYEYKPGMRLRRNVTNRSATNTGYVEGEAERFVGNLLKRIF